jgi:hypothetical protein
VATGGQKNPSANTAKLKHMMTWQSEFAHVEKCMEFMENFNRCYMSIAKDSIDMAEVKALCKDARDSKAKAATGTGSGDVPM